MPFYALINCVLYDEAVLAEIDQDLIKDGLLEERVHPVYKSAQEKLFSLWEKFENVQNHVDTLLEKCTDIYQKKRVYTLKDRSPFSL